MARKATKKTAKKRHIWPIVLLWLVIVLSAICLFLNLNARRVHLRYAEVTLTDLPAAFDGTTVLYVSDIDARGFMGTDYVKRLFGQLGSLHPDMFIIGGDLSDEFSFIESDGDKARESVFEALKDFTAPMGKLAVATESDGAPERFSVMASQYGFRSLNGQMITLHRDGSYLTVAGVGAGGTNVSAMATATEPNACVIVVADSPDRLGTLRTAETPGGGTWADLILMGGTHDGQIVLGDRTLLPLSDAEQKYRSGWTTEMGIPTLTTSGLGCEYIGFRLFTAPEVWLITLKKA